MRNNEYNIHAYISGGGQANAALAFKMKSLKTANGSSAVVCFWEGVNIEHQMSSNSPSVPCVTINDAMGKAIGGETIYVAMKRSSQTPLQNLLNI